MARFGQLCVVMQQHTICFAFVLTLLFYLSLPAMPKSYVRSKPPPDQPVEDWLKWMRSDFEQELLATLPTLATIM